MPKSLDIVLRRNGDKLTAIILDQDEDLRGKNLILEKNGFKIVSCNCPELKGNTLFIRGTNSKKDEDIVSCYYKTEDAAFIAYHTFLNLIDELNEIGI